MMFLVSTIPLYAQPGEGQPSQGHDHHGTSVSAWEGSPQGVAYSEFNHHLTGLLIFIIGLSELCQALGARFWAWTRFLLPGGLLATGSFLFIWSDHEAWPIGSLSFMQTFFGSDPEIFQHKGYALLSLLVGVIELFRRLGTISHVVWVTPLPMFAVIGGLMLFGHSHGFHPAAAKIALGHMIMGTMSVTAGSSKLLSDWFRSSPHKRSSRWELLWAGLILLIGLHLLLYSE
jgi:putative copper resistance protein D